MRSDIISACKTWATVAVVLFHYVRHLVSHSDWGSIFVMAGGIMAHVFFFVSGWGQYLSYDRRQQMRPGRLGVQAWLLGLVKKVYFPYIVVISIIGLIAWLMPHIFPPQSWNAFFSHVLGYKMFDAALLTSFGDHFWFLSPLLCLYILTPLLILCIKKYPRLTLISSCLISVIYAVWLVSAELFWWRQWQVGFPSFLWQYVAGMTLAYRRWKPEDMMYFVLSWRGGVVSVVLGCLYVWLSLEGGIVGRVFNDRCALPLVIMLCIASSQWELLKKVAVWGSGVSYYIFLIHGLWFMIWKGLIGGVTASVVFYALCSLFVLWGGMVWYQHRSLP